MSADYKLVASEAEQPSDFLCHMIMIDSEILLSGTFRLLTDGTKTILFLQDIVVLLKSDSELTS